MASGSEGHPPARSSPYLALPRLSPSPSGPTSRQHLLQFPGRFLSKMQLVFPGWLMCFDVPESPFFTETGSVTKLGIGPVF